MGYHSRGIKRSRFCQPYRFYHIVWVAPGSAHVVDVIVVYPVKINASGEFSLRAVFRIFCKRDFCVEVRDFKISEPEAESSHRRRRLELDGLPGKMLR